MGFLTKVKEGRQPEHCSMLLVGNSLLAAFSRPTDLTGIRYDLPYFLVGRRREWASPVLIGGEVVKGVVPDATHIKVCEVYISDKLQ
jgi:hypothetical protein